jgi:hypothetical protein
MLEEIDTAARRIWLQRPNRSSSGNLRVKEYTSSPKAMASFQVSSFSKLNLRSISCPGSSAARSRLPRREAYALQPPSLNLRTVKH